MVLADAGSQQGRRWRAGVRPRRPEPVGRHGGCARTRRRNPPVFAGRRRSGIVKWPSRFDIEQMLGVLGLVLTISSLLVVISKIPHGTANLQWGLLAAFFLAIAGGEYLRVEMPGSRETAPMSVAAALALAMTSDAAERSSAHMGVATVVTLTAAAMAAGLLSLRLSLRLRMPLAPAHRARAPRAADIVGRLVGVAVAAVLFRGMPVWNGHSVLQL